MSIELRRLLIGDTNGDFNFMRYLNEVAPRLALYPDVAYRPYGEKNTYWVIANEGVGVFCGRIQALWLRRLKVTLVPPDSLTASHFAPVFVSQAVVRFGLGLSVRCDGRFGLRNIAYITPTGPGYYEVRAVTSASYWWVSVESSFSSSAQQDVDEVRLWEYVDIEPYLDELISSQTDTEVFQMPYGRYFSGTHYRYTSKRLTVALLVPRSETQFLKTLEGLLTKPSPNFPLELFIDNYLYRCALSGYRVEPVSGLVKRVVIDLSLLHAYAYHQNRVVSVSSMQYPSTSAPVIHHVTNDLSDVETPCEVRVYVGNAMNGYKIRVTVTPSKQQAVFIMDGTESFKLLSFTEDGRVLLTNQDDGVTVEDVTWRLEAQSRVPFVLHPGTNTIIVERLDSNNNPKSDSAYWQIAVAYNPRIGEVVGL